MRRSHHVRSRLVKAAGLGYVHRHVTEANLPIMTNAREDLGATVFGRFSPDDWDRILAEASRRLDAHLAADPQLKPQSAWHRVMVEFKKEAHWGFRSDYKPPRRKRAPLNMGVRLIWVTFITFTFTKIAIAWFGQIWSRTGEAKDKYIFFLVIALSLSNFGYFLWTTRNHRD